MAKQTEHEHQHGVLVETGKPEIARPPLYSVLLLNDDYTPMDFVVAVLVRFFRKTEAEATRVMLDVHRAGVGVAGVYAFEIAETKVNQVEDAAREAGHPLQCTMEPA